MANEAVLERVEQISGKIAGDLGFEYVHSEVAGTKRSPIVRIFIDKPEGVTIEDCSVMSRAVEEVLDTEDLIPSAYVLEVSSPGLDRGLYKLEDFKRFAGKKAKVKTASPIGGQSNFNGRITDVDGEEILFEDKTNGAVRIPIGMVAKANLKVDLADEFKKR